MVGKQILGALDVQRHGALQGKHLLPGARAEGNAVSTRRRLQRPERAGLIRIGLDSGQVARSPLLLFDEHTAAGQRLQQPRDDLVQQRV